MPLFNGKFVSRDTPQYVLWFTVHNLFAQVPSHASQALWDTQGSVEITTVTSYPLPFSVPAQKTFPAARI